MTDCTGFAVDKSFTRDVRCVKYFLIYGRLLPGVSKIALHCIFFKDMSPNVICDCKLVGRPCQHVYHEFIEYYKLLKMHKDRLLNF